MMRAEVTMYIRTLSRTNCDLSWLGRVQLKYHEPPRRWGEGERTMRSSHFVLASCNPVNAFRLLLLHKFKFLSFS